MVIKDVKKSKMKKVNIIIFIIIGIIIGYFIFNNNSNDNNFMYHNVYSIHKGSVYSKGDGIAIYSSSSEFNAKRNCEIHVEMYFEKYGEYLTCSKLK